MILDRSLFVLAGAFLMDMFWFNFPILGPLVLAGYVIVGARRSKKTP